MAEMMGLVNLWFMCTMTADVLLIAGSVGRILISHKVRSLPAYLCPSVCLSVCRPLVFIV